MPDASKQTKRFADVLGHRMAYVDVGQGAPVVLLHGDPTSSFLWRSVIPELSSARRCIAPDLIGMGDSDKLPLDHADRYTFRCHRGFLDALLDTLELTRRPLRPLLVAEFATSGVNTDGRSPISRCGARVVIPRSSRTVSQAARSKLSTSRIATWESPQRSCCDLIEASPHGDSVSSGRRIREPHNP
jgi:hypothetical protein